MTPRTRLRDLAALLLVVLGLASAWYALHRLAAPEEPIIWFEGNLVFIAKKPTWWWPLPQPIVGYRLQSP